MQIPEGKGRPFIVFLDDEPAHLEQGLYIAVKAAQAAAAVPPVIEPLLLSAAQAQAQQGHRRAQIVLAVIRTGRLPLLELPGPVVIALGLVIGPSGAAGQRPLTGPFQEGAQEIGICRLVRLLSAGREQFPDHTAAAADPAGLALRLSQGQAIEQREFFQQR